MIKDTQHTLKLQEIAKYTPRMLENMTVAGLKRLAVGIVANYGKMKKPQLIQQLLAATSRPGAVKKQETLCGEEGELWEQGDHRSQQEEIIPFALSTLGTQQMANETSPKLDNLDADPEASSTSCLPTKCSELSASYPNTVEAGRGGRGRREALGEELLKNNPFASPTSPTSPAKSPLPPASPTSYPPAKVLGDWTVGLYKDFRSTVIARRRTDGTWDDAIYADIASFGYRVIRFLDLYSGEQPGGGLAMTTKMRYRTHICNLLSEQVEAERADPDFPVLSSCLSLLLRQIQIQIADISCLKKGLQLRQLAQRKKHKEIISFQPLHEFAINVFTRLDKLKAPDWKKVSIALAITTGRRMAEIHLDSTLFEYIDEWLVDFTGQLKVKGDASEYFQLHRSYTIPVLVDAPHVIKAHQWLKDNGKVVATAIAANKRYSGDLSAAMRILRSSMDIQHEFFTYKGLRTIYAQVSNQLFNHDDPDNTLYLAQILGHGRAELLRSDNLTDMLTPQSYNSDFRVVNTECVFADSHPTSDTYTSVMVVLPVIKSTVKTTY